MNAFDIVAYTYQAEQLCPTCTIETLIRDGFLDHTARDVREETALDQAASRVGVNRHDERSFDSGEFPKVVFASQVENEACGSCGDAL